MGGKPSPGTPKDKRLKSNKGTASTPTTTTSSSAAKPKFGSPAWQAKYGTGKGARSKR